MRPSPGRGKKAKQDEEIEGPRKKGQNASSERSEIEFGGEGGLDQARGYNESWQVR
jgi:hypothetical protein